MAELLPFLLLQAHVVMGNRSKDFWMWFHVVVFKEMLDAAFTLGLCCCLFSPSHRVRDTIPSPDKRPWSTLGDKYVWVSWEGGVTVLPEPASQCAQTTQGTLPA